MTVESSVAGLLESLGADLNDENYKETPLRVAKYFKSRFTSEEELSRALAELKEKVFPSDYKGVIFQGPIESYGLCPHHLLPVFYTAFVAYVPKEKCVGLSKLTRMTQMITERPVLQEQATEDVASMMKDLLEAEHVAVSLHGVHTCMKIRGVKGGATTVTNSLRGDFYHDSATRSEFFEQIKQVHR